MSKKAKISPEDLRTVLEEIFKQFSPIELKIRSRKFFLSESSLEAIQQSLKITNKAEKSKIVLPESTINLARYGPTMEEIIENSSDYIESKQIKKMSQRKGSFYIEVSTWNRRKIENALKKTKKLKTKSKDDYKFFQEEIQTLKSLLPNKEAVYKKFHDEFLQLIELFTNPLTDLYTELSKGKGYFYDLKNLREAIIKEQQDLSESENSLSVNQEKLGKITKELELFWSEFYQTSTGGLFKRKETEIQDITKRDPLNHYLEILKELFDAFDNFIKKQQVQITDDNKKLLKIMLNSLIVPIPDLTTRFPSFIEFYLVFADDVFGKKLNRKPEYADKFFLLESPGWKSWLQQQLVAQDLEQLKDSDEYRSLREKTHELSSEKQNLLHSIEEIEKKIIFHKQNIEDMFKQEEGHFNQFFEWVRSA